MVGPTMPPTFARELIKAIPVAAAGPCQHKQGASVSVKGWCIRMCRAQVVNVLQVFKQRYKGACLQECCRQAVHHAGWPPHNGGTQQRHKGCRGVAVHEECHGSQRSRSHQEWNGGVQPTLACTETWHASSPCTPHLTGPHTTDATMVATWQLHGTWHPSFARRASLFQCDLSGAT